MATPPKPPVKRVRKPASKAPAARQAASAKQAVKPQEAAPAAAAPADAKIRKPKKPKLVRDSFTIPKQEYESIGLLKTRSEALGHPVKKSELIRAGIQALAAMDDKQLIASLKVVPAIKTGRPAKA